MPLIRAQVRFPYFTNLPEDVWTNTLYFNSSIVGDMNAQADALDNVINEFYTEAYVGVGIAPYLASAGRQIRFYNMTDPEPRQPTIRPLVLTGVAVTGTNIPTEVAAVLSFHGQPTSGIPMNRMRGRIYLGGLPNGAMTTVSAGGAFPTWTSAFRDSVTEAAEDLRENASALNAPWVVVSRAEPGIFEVIGGWMDDGPDTQRRRSVGSAARTLWPD